MTRLRNDDEPPTTTRPDRREEKMRSIFMQPGAAARAPKGRPRTTESNTRPERFGHASHEASNATLKAKGKGDELLMVTGRVKTRLHSRTTHRHGSCNRAITFTSIAARCVVNLTCSLWKDKALALNFPKPEPKSSPGRNAAAVNVERSAAINTLTASGGGFGQTCVPSFRRFVPRNINLRTAPAIEASA
jgi:hypothetical protein